MLSDLSRTATQFAKTNSSTILTSVAVVGTVSTAVLAGRFALKCEYIINYDDPMTRREQAAYVLKHHWKDLAPVAISGGLTVGAILMANRIETRKAAAFAAAYGISERAFQEYKDKVVEKIGEAKTQSIRDELAQERVNRNPVKVQQVIITGSGEVLCYDSWSGRYFMSSVEEIKPACNKINHEILNQEYAVLSTFYDYIGLSSTTSSDLVGWNNNQLMDVSLSTTLSDDDRPCVVMDFQNNPQEGYGLRY